MTEIFIPFSNRLYAATFINRPNRFILECELISSGEEIVVHLPDPGRLKELLFLGQTIYVSYHDQPNRKTKWSAVLVQDPETNAFVSLNANLANQLVEKALKHSEMEEFHTWDYERREFIYQGSRWDFLLKQESRRCALEVKSVTLAQGNIAYFPDAVTKRGSKHLQELAAIASDNQWEAALLFICQRDDMEEVRPAEWIDPVFAKSLRTAKKAGVHIYARKSVLSLEGITLLDSIPVHL